MMGRTRRGPGLGDRHRKKEAHVAATSTRTDQSNADPEAVERELRIQLAAAYRLADKFGMSELIATHISLRVPGPTPTFLFNRSGLLFDEVTASNLVRIDLHGTPVNGEKNVPLNRAGVNIHGAILEARPDVNCVLHTHNVYSIAVASTEAGLLPLSQAAMRFTGQVAYHDYGRAATDQTERSRLQEDLGDKWVMLLRNHGILTTGTTVGDAFVAAFYLEKACQAQAFAQAMGQPLVLPEAGAVDDAAQGPARGVGENRAWLALLRRLDREDPSYKD
jgi:ribulose-5-phosphate 4-epimerase/fuculose-1-phosphate aldolase